MTKLPIRIAPILLAYDYGRKERGPSLEKSRFCPALCRIAQEVVPFWLEEEGFPDDLSGLQRRIEVFVEARRPDLVFTIVMKDEIAPETFDFLKGRVFTVNWFCDDQWRFDDFSRFLAPRLSAAITTDPFAVPRYRKIGVEAAWAPWGVETFADEARLDERRYAYDVSFVGGADRSRRWFVRRLEGLLGRPVACFGAGWPAGRVSEEEMEEIMIGSKINLNLSNSRNDDVRFVLASPGNAAAWLRAKKTGEQLKARNIEIPAAGGFELSHYAPGLERYFALGEEIDVFDSPESAAVKIAYYLAEEERREAMKLRAYRRARDYRLDTVLRRVFRDLGVAS